MKRKQARLACLAKIQEVAEDYVMGSLSIAEALVFGEHFPDCLRCAHEVESTESFVDAIRTASQNLRCGTDRAALTRVGTGKLAARSFQG